jgi:hypothetical protein
MRASPFFDLRRGAVLLASHPLWTLVLAVVGTLLSLLAPLLQIGFKLPGDPGLLMLLSLVTTLPLGMYFIPRYMLELDAETRDHPKNPRPDWRATFERRWLKAFGVRLLFSFVLVLGTCCFIVPGVLLLIHYGWVPTRVLLRGESIKEAMIANSKIMEKFWLPVALSACVTGAVYSTISLLVASALTYRFTNPTAWQQLTNPAFWAADFLSLLAGIWFNASLLSLFHRLESESEAVAEPGDGN